MTISKISLVVLAFGLSSGSAFAQTATAPAPTAPATIQNEPTGKQGDISKTDCQAGWKAESKITPEAFKIACGL